MTLILDGTALPHASDEAMADRNLERLHQWMQDAPDEAAPLQDRLDRDEGTAKLLISLFGNSPYLSFCLLKEPTFLPPLLTDGPEATLARLMKALPGEIAEAKDTPQVMHLLRQAKRRVSLLVAIADIAGVWALEPVTAALSDFAQLALSLATRHLLGNAHRAGEIVLPHPDEPERDSGIVILGMGKLGARELNYSSDIDLVIFYDGERIDYRGRRSVPEFCVKFARELCRVMEEHTEDGYVFRTDLRLRPDPGSTPPAISLLAAEAYYEAFGQNWERAAMIKARQVAGDPEAGAAFLGILTPFIWRKHLDFAAIQDIHSIKRQINAHFGGADIAVPGHNIKLGRGGIREIEFFVQTQQLIWGGRDASLRGTSTLGSLVALSRAGHVAPAAVEELADAYRFLRRVEHRLQMIDDQQSQTLPNDRLKLRSLAVFLGFVDETDFADALQTHFKAVERHYARLFEGATPLAPSGNLVFTGTEDDPDTLATLAAMGFKDAKTIAGVIRGWHHGRAQATKSARARELLTELVPSLLAALAQSAEPDAAFRHFAAFLDALPMGVPLFALLTNNPGLLGLLSEIMGSAPRLAATLSAHSSLFDGVLTPDFFDPLPTVPVLAADLDAQLVGADFEEALDAARRWAGERKFRVGVQILRNMITAEQAASAFSDIAEASLTAVQTFVERDFARQHGRFEGEGAAIVAMGKMGSREMTASSDLDLILVYHVKKGAEQSDGARPLAPSVYYARLTQRIVTALSAKTSEGALYEVDLRLRPSGNSGPVATGLEAFSRYHAESSWTWEHMALTKARVVTGTPWLRAEIEAIIRRTLLTSRDPAHLAAEAADMRRRIFAEHGTTNPWEVKQRAGGLIDVEFIAQYLQLRHGARHPELLGQGTAAALRRARSLGLLAPADGDALEEALGLWTAIQQILRVTQTGGFDAAKATLPIKRLLAKSCGEPSFETLFVLMEQRAASVRALFKRLIEDEAALDSMKGKD